MRSKEAESLTKLNRVQGLLSWAILVGLGLTLVAAYLYVLDCGRKGTLTYENLLPEEATEGYLLKRFDGLIARSHSDVKVDFYHPVLHIWQFSYATPTTDLSTLQNLGQWARRRSWKLVEIDSHTAFFERLTEGNLKMVARVRLLTHSKRIEVGVAIAQTSETASERWSRADKELGAFSQPRRGFP